MKAAKESKGKAEKKAKDEKKSIEKKIETQKAEEVTTPAPKPELKPIVADKVPDWNQPVVW